MHTALAARKALLRKPYWPAFVSIMQSFMIGSCLSYVDPLCVLKKMHHGSLTLRGHIISVPSMHWIGPFPRKLPHQQCLLVPGTAINLSLE